MQIVRRLGIPMCAALAAATIAVSISSARSPSRIAGEMTQQAALKPLVNVHELMEHVVEHPFTALKTGMKEKPADAKAWRSVRDTSLLLGETGNLLLMRKPEDADAKEWVSLCISLRDSGDALSRAAKAKDFDAGKKAYLVMVNSCNQCHAQYGDDGEPKIEP